MDAHLKAGVAIFNAGRYHAAHDAWEDCWLDLKDERGADAADARFLQGLIQFTAAVHHARDRNWSGATGLAESGREYLDGLSDDYRGVNVATVREYLRGLARDPERIERGPPPALTWEGEPLALDDLHFDALAVAAEVFAEELGYDEDVIEAGIEYARADLGAGDEGSDFVTFVADFARSGGDRGIVFQRLSERVQRRRERESDVEGLFEER